MKLEHMELVLPRTQQDIFSKNVNKRVLLDGIQDL